MAEVITRFKLETTQYDSKLRDASKSLSEFAKTASLAGSEFDKFTKNNVNAAKAFGSIETSATNAKDKVKELVSAYNDMAKAYNSLTKEQQQSDFGKATAASMQQLKGRIGDAKKELYGLGDQAKSTGGFMDALSKKVMVNIDAMKILDTAINAVKGALSVVGDAFMSNESDVDAWGRTMEEAGSLYNSFVVALNSSNFGSFFSNIDAVTKAARDAYDAMDKLRTIATIQSPERAKLQARQTELQAIIRNKGKDSAEGKAAQQQLIALQPALRASFRSESSLNKAAFETQVRKRLAEGGVKLGAADFAYLMKSFESEDAYKRLVGNARGSIKNVSSGMAGGTAGYSTSTTVDTRNINAKLRDLFTDEWRQTYSPYLTASYSALGSSFANDRANARYLNGGGGGGKGGAGGGAVPYVPLTQALDFNMPGRTYREGAPIWQPETGETWKEFEGRRAQWANSIEGPSGGLKGSIQPIDLPKEFVKEFQRSIEQSGNRTTAWDDFKDISDNMSKMTSSMSQLVSGVQQLGIKVPSGITKMLTMLQGITTILTAIETMQQVGTWLGLFNKGGVVRAAAGYQVPGNYGYDAVPSLLTSGEVVLNRAQTAGLARRLQSQGESNGTPTARISGEQIYIALTNYMNRRGYGETLISR